MEFLIHFASSILLFLVSNWIGKHSFSYGYVSASLELGNSQRPAFDFLYKILGPTVAVVLLSALFYNLKIDAYATRIWLVSVYYVGIRATVIIILERAKLVNWPKQIVYWALMVFFSYMAQQYLITPKNLLLPSIESLSEELWVLIILFLYQLANRLDFDSSSLKNRQSGYLSERLESLKLQYAELIEKEVQYPDMIDLIYAIMIHESFNRPKIIRLLESAWCKLSGKAVTQGVMQVRSSIAISDRESVELGIKKLNDSFKECVEYFEGDDGQGISDYLRLPTYFHRILNSYNGGSTYYEEIHRLIHKIEMLRLDALDEYI